MLISEILNINESHDVYINMLAHFAVGMITNREMRKEISKLYETDKYNFYKLAKENSAYTGEYIVCGGIDREFHAKKALGIILSAEENKTLSARLTSIIIRYYPVLHSYVSKRNFDAIRNEVSQMRRNMVPPEVYRAYEAMALYLTIKHARKDEVYQNEYDFMTEYFQMHQGIIESSLSRIDIDERIEAERTLIDGIKKRILENKGDITTYEKLYHCKDELVREHLSIASAIFDFEWLAPASILSENDPTDRDINKILLAYAIGHNDKNLEKTTITMVYGLIIQRLLNDYRNMKEIFFANNKETTFYDFEALENKSKQLQAENEQLKKENAGLIKELNDIVKKNDERIASIRKPLENEIERLQKKLVKKDNEIESQKTLQTEVSQLRELLFSIQNEYVPQETIRSINEFAKEMKILVIGGSQEFRRRIKDKCPEIITMDGFNENYDIGIMNGVDYVFFYTGYMNHGTYYRAINYIRSRKLGFGYIGKTNVELVEKEMIEELEKQIKL